MDRKNIVITGGGGILCSEMARGLTAAGHRVALLDLNESAARAVAEDINRRWDDERAFALPTDVLCEESLAATLAQILDRWSSIEVLINGAGGNQKAATLPDEKYVEGSQETLFSMDSAALRQCFDLNFFGSLLPIKIFGKVLVKHAPASIINIASVNSYLPLSRIPAYAAAKAAVTNLTQWAAYYFSDVPLRVNAIAPGFLLTHQTKPLFYDEAGAPSARLQKILQATPMGRLGNASELIGTILWLIDENASSFVTGAMIPIDGGYTAYSGV